MSKIRRLKAAFLLLIIGIVLAIGCGRKQVVELPIEASVATSVVELPVENVDTGGNVDTGADTDASNGSDSIEATEQATIDYSEVYGISFVIDELGVYTTKDDLAAYIHEFGKLPQNFITKKEAQALGWPGGSLEEYAPGKCIGGDRFGNYEGLLPDEKGRKYYECDVETLGKSSRGAKRIVYSNDGLIFYTEDHYESFEQLY